MAAVHLVQPLLSIPVLIRQNPCCLIVLVSLLVLCSKVWPVIRGGTFTDHSWVTGFGPFNLPTCDMLPKGRDHSKKLSSLAGVLFGIAIAVETFFFLSFFWGGGVSELFFANVRHVYYCIFTG